MKPVIGMFMLMLVVPAIIVSDSGYSSYIGWAGLDGVAVASIDNMGNLLLHGTTDYNNIPTTQNAYQKEYQGGREEFFMILSSEGDISYLSYFGGTGNDYCYVFKRDVFLYLCGATNSRDLPVTDGCYQATYGGGDRDCFVAKLNIETSELVFCTYIGGTGYDDVWPRLVVDDSGDIYLGGYTTSQSFPRTPGAAQRLYGGGEDDAFVTKLYRDGTHLVYSTLLGGNGNDEALGLAVDSLGQAYVCGVTGSTDFPVKGGAYQDTLSTVFGNCFVTKLSANGQHFLESTYIGGKYQSRADALLLDGEHGLYITGRAGQGFPTTTHAYRATTTASIWDGFVAKISPDLSTIIYSSYTGGDRTTELSEIARDNNGNIYVSGGTYDPEFPVPAHSKYPPGENRSCDMVVVVLDSTLSSLVYGAVIGGAEWDFVTGLVLDRDNNMYVSGITESTDFSTTPGAFQEQYGGGDQDGVLVMIPAEDIVVSTPPLSLQPATCTLQPSYPNPVSGSGTLTIPYSVSERGNGEIAVYTTTGAKVASYPLSHGTAGAYSISLALPSLPQGVYFSTLTYNGKQQTKRFIVQE